MENLVSTEAITRDISLGAVIMSPGSRTIGLGIERGQGRVEFNVVMVSYRDVFGNEYRTRYESFPGDAFVWDRPPIRARRQR